MQWNDKTVHDCHNRLWWLFSFTLLSLVNSSRTQYGLSTRSHSQRKQNKRKPFLYQTEGQHLACITLEVVKMLN